MKSGYVYEHILVWEKANGRPLPDGYVVHHLNGLKYDNRPENLVAIPKGKHHFRLFYMELQKRIRQLESIIEKHNKELEEFKGEVVKHGREG